MRPANFVVPTVTIMLNLAPPAPALQPVTYMRAAAELSIRTVSEHCVRITIAPTGRSGKATLPKMPWLVERRWSKPTAALTKVENGTSVEAGRFRIGISTTPLTLAVRTSDGRLLQELAIEDSGRMTFLPGKSPLLGLGEGAKQFDRRGGSYSMKTGSHANMNAEERLNIGGRIAVPFLIGTGGWAMFVNSPWGQFDLTGNYGAFAPADPGTPAALDVFIIDAANPADAMKEFASLTGQPAMPPKWTMGYMQSHRTLAGPDEVLKVASTFREKQLPCDALIYLGTGFCPAGWNLNNQSVEFNPKTFDKPAEMLSQLHSENFHVIMHFADAPKTLHGSIPAAKGETVDDTHAVKYWEKHRPDMAIGVDAWWPDEGDWLTLEAMLARHRMYFQGPLLDRPNVRPFCLQRNGCVGMTPYGGWVWSGDVDSSWRALRTQIPVGINTGLSCSPFWGTDIGGFIPTKDLTGELYVRWFQFGAFCPLFRSHGRTWHLRLPWGWNTGEVGPIEERTVPDASELHNEQVEPICRKYMNLRYSLLSYNYSITREAHDTGMPMMRSLWLHYPEDPEAANQSEEYLWGRDILVAPVVEKAAEKRELYLPKGEWYDWWTGEKNTGGRTVTRNVDLETMPLYVRAGAIIPIDPPRQYVSQPASETATLRIYTGADGSFTLYEDDGTSLDYLKGAGSWTEFSWNDGARTLTIRPGRKNGSAAERAFKVVTVPGGAEKAVTYSGTKVVVKL